jgi:hypothetical protein
MPKIKLLATITAVLAASLLVSPGPARASPAGKGRATGRSAVEPHPAIAPAGAIAPGARPRTADAAAARDCVFFTRFDDVHWSSTAGDVSGHGWWDNGDCPAKTRANITIRLEEYYSDGTWRTKNTGTKKKAYEGGGSAIVRTLG